MDPRWTDTVVEEVLKRLRRRVLLVLTRADGYRDEIFLRLRGLERVVFDVTIADNAAGLHDAGRWAALGKLRAPADCASPAALAPYQMLLLPFLDAVTAAELADARPASATSEMIYHALLAGKTTLALPYNCDPHSELNRVRGLGKNPAYAARVQAHLATLSASGMTLCSLDEAEQLLSGTPAERAPAATMAQRYLTRREIAADRTLADAPGVRLTDAASDYLKQSKK